MSRKLQQEIQAALGVESVISTDAEYTRRVAFLKSYLIHSGAKGYVLGISGGQDSTLAGKLAQIAVSSARRETGIPYEFVGVRLPYGTQTDEADAQLAMSWIAPDTRLGVDIKSAVDAQVFALHQAGIPVSDFVKGNIKARQRMIAQYAIAGERNLLVIGTDHAAESLTGFFTKHGDGACDVVPLAGLTKGQGRALLATLNAPKPLITKVPTADLEDGKPGLPDEAALGVSYREIDAYLEGRLTPAAGIIEAHYRKTEHKRRPPVTPSCGWW